MSALAPVLNCTICDADGIEPAPPAGRLIDLVCVECWLDSVEAEIHTFEQLPARVQHIAQVRATLARLMRLQALRDAGRLPRPWLTADVTWLVNEAINRRAGWAEDPHTRGTSQRNHRGALPRKCDGAWQAHLRLIAHEVNTPRLTVYVSRLGEHRWLTKRLPHRFTERFEE